MGHVICAKHAFNVGAILMGPTLISAQRSQTVVSKLTWPTLITVTGVVATPARDHVKF